jgi:hypothetical protein
MRVALPDQRGKNNRNWRGGRHVDSRGYVTLVVDENDEIGLAMLRTRPGHHKYGQNHMHEHRLVMARYLGRPLTSEEVVHHINGDKTDNRLENLQIVGSRSEHMKAIHFVECPHCGESLRGELTVTTPIDTFLAPR